MPKHRLHAIALLLLLLTVTGISYINPEASASAPFTSADLLHRQGNQLVNGMGTPVILRGTTGDFVHNPEGGWMTTSGFKFGLSAATEQLDLMQKWGFNSFRITMAVEPWLNNTDNNRANLRYVIAQAEQRGMYVTIAPYSVLSSSDASGEWEFNALPYPPYQGDQSYKTLPATQAVIPDKQSFIDFYGELVNDLKDYPNVLFEVWNEPHANIYGGEAARSDFFANVVNPIIANARSSGAEQPFVLDGSWGGINANDYLQYAAEVPDSNLVISFHLYTHFGHLDTWGNPTDYNGLLNAFIDSGVVGASKTYPIYFGEMGITAGSVSERVQYDNILHIFHDLGWSWSAWWFHDADIYAFVDSNANPTAEGLIYQKWLDTAAQDPSNTPMPTPSATPIPTPTSTLAPVPTPSATTTPTATPDMQTSEPSTNPTTPNPTSTKTEKPTAPPTTTTQPTPNQTDSGKTDSTNQKMPNQIGLYIAGLATPTIVAFAVGLMLVTKRKKRSFQQSQ